MESVVLRSQEQAREAGVNPEVGPQLLDRTCPVPDAVTLPDQAPESALDAEPIPAMAVDANPDERSQCGVHARRVAPAEGDHSGLPACCHHDLFCRLLHGNLGPLVRPWE